MMGSVVAETIALLKERSPSSLKDVLVDDLVIGIFFTGVKLSTGHAGVAFTPSGDIPEAVCCSHLRGAHAAGGETGGETRLRNH